MLPRGTRCRWCRTRFWTGELRCSNQSTCAPSTRHGRSLRRLVSGELPSTLDEAGRYFIDRNGELFVFVLDWLRTAGDAEVVARASPDVLGRLRIEADFYGIDDLAAACTANLERLAQKDKENVRARAAPPRRTSTTTAPAMPAKEPSPPPRRPREPLDAALFAGPGDDDSDF